MQKGRWIYILTNKHHTVLYTGVTFDRIGRIQDHKGKVYASSFIARYNVKKLIYYRLFRTIEEDIAEEKRIKGGSRHANVKLIESLNSGWDDLWLSEVFMW